MRTTIETIHQRVIAARPWLPWIAPAALGGADALNLVKASILVYLVMLAVAVTITTSALVGKCVACAAEKAQVKEAMLLGYQLHAEHCNEHQGAEHPQAVGDDGPTVPLAGRRLHVVPPPDDQPAAKGQVYRGTATTAVTLPTSPALPRQSAGRQSRLAAGQRLRPQP